MRRKKVKKFVYHGFGFPIILLDVPMIRVRGEWTPCINYEKLQHVVLLHLVNQRYPLTGNQVHFIRSFFQLNARKFGDKFGVTQPAVSKWENHENDFAMIEPATEFCMRLFIIDQLGGEKVSFMIHRLVEDNLIRGKLRRPKKYLEKPEVPEIHLNDNRMAS